MEPPLALNYATPGCGSRAAKIAVIAALVIMAFSVLDSSARMAALGGSVNFDYSTYSYVYRGEVKDYAATLYYQFNSAISSVRLAEIGALAVITLLAALSRSAYCKSTRITILLAWVGLLGTYLVPLRVYWAGGCPN